MSAIPPNNLDQVIAWIRIFIQENEGKFQALKSDLKDLATKFKHEDDEDVSKR